MLNDRLVVEFALGDALLSGLAPATLEGLVVSALATALISLGVAQIDSATKDPAMRQEYINAGNRALVS